MKRSPDVLTQLRQIIQEAPLELAAKDFQLRRVDKLNSDEELQRLVSELRDELEAVTIDEQQEATVAPPPEKLEVRRLLQLGERIPSGGICPRLLVFRNPPRKATTRSTEKTASLLSELAPPEPGIEVTTEMGYSEEDIRILKIVGNYRFGDVLNHGTIDTTLMPESREMFEREHFMRGLRNSISLSAEEKFRIIASLPQLSSFQFVSLLKILDNEMAEFRKYPPACLMQLRSRETRYLTEWEDAVIFSLHLSRQLAMGCESLGHVVAPAQTKG